MTHEVQPGLRFFVALLLDSAILDELQAYQKLLRKQTASEALRWARVDQMHLTLRFLGAVDEAVLPQLEGGIEACAAQYGPIRLELGPSGVFPDPRRPRVIWVGLKGDLERLAALQREVERALGPLAAHEETRGFQPHLTLARVRQGAALPPGWAHAMGMVRGPQPLTWVVRQAHLMQSELRPEGARYTVLKSACLSGR